MTTFLKIEERVKEQYHCWIIGKSLCVNLCASWQGRLANMPNLYSHSRKHSQQDCLLQNRRGTALRISRARLPTWLLPQKSKRHCSPNLESQTPSMIAFSKIDEASFSESIEEALAFSKAGLLRDHEGWSQKSRGTFFSSLVSTCHTHTQLCGNYGHSVEDFWWSRKHMNLTVQSPTSHTQQ